MRRIFATALAARAALLATGWCAAAAAATGEDELAAVRAEWIAAYAAASAPAPAADSEALRHYLLYPYLEAARLRAMLAGTHGPGATAADALAAEFVARHGGEPVASGLRRSWLESLARRGAWQLFLEQYRDTAAPDPVRRCQALTARIALRPAETGLIDDSIQAWLTPRSAPDECDPVFDWLRAGKRLDDELIERRARLALAHGETRVARWLARQLPDDRAQPLFGWARLIEHPRHAIDALIATPAAPVEAVALLDGWERLARSDPKAADQRYEALLAARKLDAEQTSRFTRALALGLAWNRLPGAGARFRLVAAAHLDASALEWRARAALWASDWPGVRAALEAMPPSLRAEARWRYWAARAAAALGRHDEARVLYAAVVPSDNWYAVLAAARLGEPFAPRSVPIDLDTARSAELDALLPFARARELLAVGQEFLAPAEWAFGYAALQPADQRQAIGLAARWGWHFQTIATAARHGLYNDYGLLYPRPYDEIVGAAAAQSGVAATLIYGIIRQESLYQPYAVSSAGAVGLMQLLPSTARQAAAGLGLRSPARSALMRPEVNVPLGAGTLTRLIDRFDGQLLVALAAYNAGPTAARRWLPEQAVEADVWVENIPFNETRAYVQRVMWHSVVFQWLAERQPQDAGSWLRTVH